ncbi:hypothetical protein [uncultured Winogradskyella sp.]|uniref:hypothetical protein n=1 Tax=uncultured Winogradskyella sp. TaxID=395353 RepID=UPI00263136F3|nr:hypothetical protein [uncultured Winogradskyella sp.]
MEEYEDFINYISKKSTSELLKLFSILQLFPENHGKNLRIEIIVSLLSKNMNNVDEELNYDGVVNAVQEMFPSDHREDPVETSFTENFLFSNGNNIVFPGIVINSSEIVQGLTYSILHAENNLSSEFKKNIYESIIFFLSIHTNIATEIGLKRYISLDNNEKELFFPDEYFFKNYKDLICFSKEEIQAIYDEFNIKRDVISNFVFDIEKDEIDLINIDKNPILLKPFIICNDIYYLIFPSAQMFSLNNFIVNELEVNGHLEELLKIYDLNIENDSFKELRKMNWSMTDLDTQIKDKIELRNGESIWQFDENKLAYVNVILNSSEDSDYEERASTVISFVRNKVNNENYQFLTLLLISSYSTTDDKFFALKDIEGSDNFLMINIIDLKRLNSNWDLNKLSLWKYCKAFDRAINKGVRIAPMYSILTYYSYYTKNNDSFLHSDEAYNGLFFDFGTQGKVITDINTKNDEHGVMFFKPKRGIGYLPVYKTAKHAPIYLSQEYYIGIYKSAIELFDYPIWITCPKKRDTMTTHFIDAIAHWLNELYPSLNKHFNHSVPFPIEFIISLDDKLYDFNPQVLHNLDLEVFNLEYEIIAAEGKIKIQVPFEFFAALYRKDNHGERQLMSVVIESMSKLFNAIGYDELSEEVIQLIIDKHIPLGSAKMILTVDSSYNLKMDQRHLPKIRFIQKYDNSYVLESVVDWLNYDKEIPVEIIDKKDKIKLLVDCVNAIIQELRNKLIEYNTLELLSFLMHHHEAIIQANEYRKLYIPARLECFSKYVDVFNEFHETESEYVNVSLSMRCLIEFASAEPYFNDKLPNNDDVDYLLALMNEMIYFGYVQDIIRFDIDSPKMGLLESGRIGISKGFFDDVLLNYNISNKEDELVDYKENFESNFNKHEKNESNEKNEEDYLKKIDEAFIYDLGITFLEINTISLFLAEYCLIQESSYYKMEEKEFIELIIKETKFNNEKINSYLNLLTLNSRGKMDKPPEGYIIPEIFPWRYNRKLSYLRKPLIRLIDNDDKVWYLWSARFLIRASDNLLYQFSNASLRVEDKHHKIKNLIAKRLNIKGKNFTNEVRDWLIQNPKLRVIDFEVKIDIKGVLIANKNYGDIDILAFDDKNKLVYSIECKNTKQAKIMYDFQRDVKNYADKQLPKHVARNDWLVDNIKQLSKRFNKNVDDYKVKSIVIASYQLPIKFLEKTKLPIYSFNEIKRSQIF